MDGAIRCTHPNCSCDCFAPGRGSKRTCSTCQHGWISHALDKLLDHRLPHKSRVSAAYDTASLILFGTNAVPIRLKVLLDALLMQFSEAEVAQLLHKLGWTEEDFSRGYFQKDPEGNRLMRWTIVNRTEEVLVMQQFLKFTETRNIAEGLLRDTEAAASSASAVQSHHQEHPAAAAAGCGSSSRNHPSTPTHHHPALDSTDIMKFIERANRESLNSSQSKCNSTVNSHPLRSSPPQPLPGTTSSPECTALSPPNKRSSPSAPSLGSPLNKLQNMQPFDFRKMFSSSSNTKHSKSSVNAVSESSPSLDGHSSLEAGYRVSKKLQHQQQLLNSLYSPAAGESSDTSANRNLLPGSVNSDDQSFSEGESGDETNLSEGAMNLSLEQAGYDMKERHSRKSSNPMKRRWNPMVLSTLVTNPSTGKRRVQCHACFKTFCDKGALKIHFSAVHLREMHKCTVDGCTMMFSSRRSRNRHSANPNPKLHSSSLRRKLNPHDGRTSNPFPSPLMRDGASGSPLLNHHLGPTSSLLNQSRMMLDQQRFGDFDKIRANLTSASSGGINDIKDSFRSNSCSPYPSDTYCESEPGSSTPKRIKSQDSRPDRRLSESNGHGRRMQDHHTGLPDDDNKDPNQDRDCDANRARKRKSANPTKFSVLHSPIAAHLSDDDLQYSSDDSSSGTYGMDGKADDNGMMEDGSDDDDDDDSIQEYMNQHRNHALKKMYEAHKQQQQQAMYERDAAAQDKRHERQHQEKQVHERSSNDDKTMDLSSNRNPSFRNEHVEHEGRLNLQPQQQQHQQHQEQHERDEERRQNSKDFQAKLSVPKTSSSPPDPHEGRENQPARKSSNDGTASNVGSENPLRHLESLSLGPFSNLLSPNSHLRTSASSLFAPSNMPFPAAAGMSFGSVPPAGLLSGSMPKMSRSSDQSDGKQELNEDYDDGDSMSRGGGESGQEDSTPTPGDGGSMSSHMFRDSSLSSFGLDIPVDKENPRRCTACGKIFQNHFGVKTHYQNVHLKLMHKCTVDGCNAAFPSKRSRDRHSANLNLHRKLLSTHSDKGLPYAFVGDKNSPFFPYGPAANLRDDFLSRFYDPQGLPLNLGDLYHGRLPPIGPDGLLAAAAAGFPGLPAGFGSPFGLSLPPHPGLPGVSLTNQEGCVAERDSPASSAGSSSSTPNSSAKYSSKSKGSSQHRRSPPSPSPTDLPTSQSAVGQSQEEQQTAKLECSHCKFSGHSADILKEHYTKHHPSELYRCSSGLCNKTFLTRSDRKRHERTFHEKENNSQQHQLNHHQQLLHHRRALISSNEGTEEADTPTRDLSPSTTRNNQQAPAAVCEISC